MLIETVLSLPHRVCRLKYPRHGTKLCIMAALALASQE